MAISQATLNINFAKTGDWLDPRVTFTRTGNGQATFLDKTGIIQKVGNNIPRFEYSSNGEPLGLLVEVTRNNHLASSEDFTATWTKTDINTTTADYTMAPDNTLTADLIREGSLGTALVSQAGVLNTAGNAAGSLFLKPGPNSGVTWMKMMVYGAGAANGAAAWFNLRTGATGTVSNIGGGTGANGFIRPYPDGWYRCHISGAIPGETSITLAFHSTDGDGSSSRVSQSLYHPWGAQLETGIFPTSYIPSATANTVRGSDIAVISGNNFTNIYNTSTNEGTLLVEYNVEAERQTSGTRILFGLSKDGSFSDRAIYATTNNGSTSAIFVGAPSALSTTSVFANTKFAVSYDTSRINYGVDGATSIGANTLIYSVTANTTGVNSGDNVILLTDTDDQKIRLYDRVYYSVPDGNTAISGLSANQYYYISFQNTTAFAVSTANGGSNVDLTEIRTGAGESHFFTVNPLPEYNTLYIGSGWSGGLQLGGHVRRFAYFPQSMSNTELASITV